MVVIRILDCAAEEWRDYKESLPGSKPFFYLILEEPFTASKGKTVSRDISMLVIHFPWALP